MNTQWEIECIRKEQGENAPITLTLYHGTTHAFDAFEVDRVNPENMFGRQFYFTSSEHDAETNYAHEDGPDLKQRLELTAERLQAEDEDLYPDEETAMRAARTMFYGASEAVLTVEVTLNKPMILGIGQDHGIVKDADDIYAIALARVAQEEDVDPDTILEDDDLHEQVNEICDEIYATEVDTFSGLIDDALTLLNMERADPNADMVLFEMLRETRSIDEVYEKIEQEPCVYLYEDETGLHNVKPVIAEVLHALGYDAIVLLNANDKCRNMEMEPETAHIALSVAHADQIKIMERRELNADYGMAM